MRHKATQAINQVTKQTVKRPLKEIQEEFEHWRKTRQKRGPIPEELWEAAIEAGGCHPIGRVSRILRLNYQKLKKLVHERYGDSLLGEDLGAGFIEVDPREVLYTVECIIEMEHSDGAKLKMHIKSGKGFDPLELAKIFWQRRL